MVNLESFTSIRSVFISKVVILNFLWVERRYSDFNLERLFYRCSDSFFKLIYLSFKICLSALLLHLFQVSKCFHQQRTRLILVLIICVSNKLGIFSFSKNYWLPRKFFLEFIEVTCVCFRI